MDRENSQHADERSFQKPVAQWTQKLIAHGAGNRVQMEQKGEASKENVFMIHETYKARRFPAERFSDSCCLVHGQLNKKMLDQN